MVTAAVNAGVVLPKGSRAVTSTAGAIADPTNDGLGATVNTRCETAPGVTATSGRAVVTVPLFTVAWIVVAVPAARAVNVAVYTPVPLSDVAPIEPVLPPPPPVNTTVSPPPVSTEVAGEAAPAGTGIVGSGDVPGLAPIVACTVVWVPAATAVKIAVYVPLAWSVVGPTVPPLVPAVTVNATVDPPIVNALPAASCACSVSVPVPPEPIVSLDTLTTDAAAEIGPPATVTVGGVEATGAELIVAPTVVAVPARTPVNVAVYVPLPLSVAGDGAIVPVLDPPATLKTTVAPPAVMLFPPPSLPCSVSVTLLPDATLPFDTVMSESTGEIA